MAADPVEVTYTGKFSGLDVPEIGQSVTRGEAFMAPAAWAAQRVGLEPTEWYCDDGDVTLAAETIAETEAATVATFNEQFLSPEEKDALHIARVKVQFGVEDP